jgi:hypothetical protein
MFAHYQRHGFTGNSNVLSWLLAGPATSLADFIDRHVSRKQ